LLAVGIGAFQAAQISPITPADAGDKEAHLLTAGGSWEQAQPKCCGDQDSDSSFHSILPLLQFFPSEYAH
ncbi:MAG: hypothetical protein GTN90_04310, partial [Xanthomonadales bacterium]|nr:hypothetical protein [Xanthomonadales bacterium]